MINPSEQYHNNLVFGRVTDKLNRPLERLLVQVFDKNFRTEQYLGECFTDHSGKYSVPWDYSQLSDRGRNLPDIALKIYKVLSPEKNILLFESDMDDIRFNAREKEEIDIIIKMEIPLELPEYDYILGIISSQIGEKIQVKELGETEKNRDITFLSRDNEIPAEKLIHVVVAHRLQHLSEIVPSFFYALLRRDIPLKNDFQQSLRARFVIDLNSDPLLLLYDIALTDEKKIYSGIASAVKKRIVSETLLNEWKNCFELLSRFREAADEYYRKEHPRKALSLISRFILEDKLTEITALFRNNRDGLTSVAKTIADAGFLKSGDLTDNTETALLLGELLGFSEAVVQQTAQTLNIQSSSDLRKLAFLNKAGWKEILSKSAGQLDLAGQAPDARLIGHHASNLVRRMEKRFPTAAFAAQLEREKGSRLAHQKEITQFLKQHDDFDLAVDNIEHIAGDNKRSVSKNAAVREELKSVQRIFKLAPHYGKTVGLLEQGIHSAQSIIAMGRSRFIAEAAPKAGIQPKEAKEMFNKAQRVHTASMLVAGEIQDIVHAMNLPALGINSLAPKLETVSKDFPHIQSLFKLTDICVCEQCRSVYSPAAYLVEILQFLENRSVVDVTVPAPPPPGKRPSAKIAKDVLFERRPDLGDIDLGCENAHTPVPYIDLVCEILEEAVAPDPGVAYNGVLSDGPDPLKGRISNNLLTTLQTAGLPITDQAVIYPTETQSGMSDVLPHYLRDKKAICKIIHNGGNHYTVYRLRQTLSGAGELAAAPEYVNTAAYNKLRNQSFAFTLPFDLHHVEATAYFSRFSVERAVLMMDFQSGGIPSAPVIAAERLGITAAEQTLISNPDAVNQLKYWNTAVPNPVDELKKVDVFLNKTGLQFWELERLLGLTFINPGKTLFIRHLDLSCNTSQKEIANLDNNALDRIHRFLRFQRKTGWELETMDEIITQQSLGAGTLDDSCLVRAADLYSLAFQTGLTIHELTGCFGSVPHRLSTPNSPESLYRQVFLNKAKNGFIDAGLEPENVDGSQLLTNFKNSLSVCLQLSARDFDQLLGLLPDNNLTFANLSRLFAASRYMKCLKLKAEDYVTLTAMIGVDFLASPRSALDFIASLKTAASLPLKPMDIRFMLRHEAFNIVERELKDLRIQQLLEKLQKEYQTVFNTHRSPYDPFLSASEQLEVLENQLAGLKDVSETDVKILVGFVQREWSSANDAKTFVDQKLGILFDSGAIKTAIDALAAAPGSNMETERKALVRAFADSVSAHLANTGIEAALEQNLATGFKSDPERIKAILSAATLKQPGPGTLLLRELLTSHSLIDTNPTHLVPVFPVITPVSFPDLYRALRLLHKLIPLINSFGLDNDNIRWFGENSPKLGWFEWDAIPYQSGQIAANYNQYSRFVDYIVFAKKLTPVSNPSDAENPISFRSIAQMLLPGSGASRAEFIEKFSLLNGYKKEWVDAVDAHLFPVFALGNYLQPAAWNAVEKCIQHLLKLGGDVPQILQYIKPTLTAVDTQKLRLALKARYDEDTWSGVLKEVMDVIRPQKRNALTAYLLCVNPSMKDETDLFDYFLADVKMEACMPSSRIVHAHNAVQLFVQRCLMGLEPSAAADVQNDKGWEQWKWMKNYRVWEANRKVFLYPENWIEAELRDDKSFLFTELENELLQNELTEFTAEDALVKYLEKLDSISFLEIVATWWQADIKTMHVFGRTKGGDPAIYYYRKFEQERYWTPWEKVDLDITGDHLLAFVRNNRLTLAWPVFSDEPDPNPKSTIPNSAPNTVVENDKPKRKLKIQLALSEYVNKRWQPKKVSRHGVLTPANYTDAPLPRDKYNLIYFEFGQQVWLVSSSFSHGQENYVQNGVFNIAGCKGYPELLPVQDNPIHDFLPDFKDARLLAQRYHEQDVVGADDLSVRNGVFFFTFYEILRKTPGQFRLTYPHQMTWIDVAAYFLQAVMMHALGGGAFSDTVGKRELKIPWGTLLPYFMEDSFHSYVIIPGFYGIQKDGVWTGPVSAMRTGSDVHKLIEDIIALYYKYMAIYQKDPNQDLTILFQELMADEDYQAIAQELENYKELKYGEEFRNMHHPLVCHLRKTLYKEGVAGLMKREIQLSSSAFEFKEHYAPNTEVIPPKLYQTWKPNGQVDKIHHYPVEDIDFSSGGGYSGYNWELFFHVPFLLAVRLTREQRFEEAMTWFHYIFNPTGALEGDVPQKYWVTKPFFLAQAADYIKQRIDSLLYNIADPNSLERKELEFAVEQWRNKPFKPHAVARFRPVAYQKSVLMKYIDLLTQWGDYLFRQDTMESVAQATQMYILADKLLGPKPLVIPPVVQPPHQTYNQLAARIGAFGDALIELENIVPDVSVLPEEGHELPPAPITLSMLYFCIPHNEKMIEYWDLIADRLFKIRHCQNIDGVERNLALFAPPIDPGMLVRAAASGLDISSVIAGVNSPTPYYRFNILSQKAMDLANEVRNLGSSLLQTLEKKDSEALSLLRSELEIKMLNAVRDMKTLQIKEAKEQINVLKAAVKMVDERYKYYSKLKKISANEQLNLDKLKESKDWQLAANVTYALGAGLALIPDFALGASGFGGSPHGAAKFGGSLLAHSTDAIGKGLSILSAIASYEASRASILAGYDRRFDDWKLQERIASLELAHIKQQITAAEIRKELAETDLKNHLLQIDNAQKTDEFMRSKFTNKDLYEWMAGQISLVYFRAYQLAHDFAKKAERSYRFELGNNDSFIKFGYWDGLKKGLQCADHLLHDIKRMETSYIDKNRREYELTKHVSLALLDPLALVRLRATGICDFEVPEVLFDMDHPGHYFRRIKSVSLSLPCVAGPYTSISAKLSLVSNKYRNTATPGAQYAEDPGNDSRFVYNVGAVQSIAVSNSQNDSGIFELNFRDERYLPFEGTGAVGAWRLELPGKDLAQYDYDTISDIILHVKYTARDGGSGLRALAENSLKNRLADIRQELSQTGLHIALSLKHDMPNQWHLLRKNAKVDLTPERTRLPYIAQSASATPAVEDIMFIARVKDNPASFTIHIDGSALPLARIDQWKLCRGVYDGAVLNTPFELSLSQAQIIALDDLMMVIKFSF